MRLLSPGVLAAIWRWVFVVLFWCEKKQTTDPQIVGPNFFGMVLTFERVSRKSF